MIPTPQHSESGPVMVDVDREAFIKILKKTERPLVLTAHSGLPKTHKYFTYYGGYLFVTKSKEPQDFSRDADMIVVNKLYTPSPGMGL